MDEQPDSDDRGGGVRPRGRATSWSPPAAEHEGRREDLRARLREEGVELLLVTAPANVRYLTGFSGSNGQVLVAAHADGDRLISDERYEERAAVEAPEVPLVLSRDPIAVAVAHAAPGGVEAGDGGMIGGGRVAGGASEVTGGASEVAARSEGVAGSAGQAGGEGAPSGAGEVVARSEGVAGGREEVVGGGSDHRERRGPRLGFEAEHLTWQAGERLRRQAQEAGVAAAATSGLVEALRVIKDAAELARLERACQLTVDALAWLLDQVVAVGRTERELAVALERRFVDIGADGIAFPSIVAAGPNSAIPHHAPTDRRLEPGDLLTIDCGALVDGYHADLTRTVAVGHLEDQLAEVHAVVGRAQAAGRAAAIAGATSGDVDAAARGVVDAAGYGERFVHGTGHGVGLDIHEAPAVARGTRATLAAGTALTVEPGIYLPGVGGVRIEDTIVVTADGPARTLTDAPRELRVL